MKKDGDWIATFGADLKVMRLVLEPNEMLDLVEVKITEVDGSPRAVHFLDRNEAATLAADLNRALSRLERSAIEGPRQAAETRDGSQAAPSRRGADELS